MIRSKLTWLFLGTVAVILTVAFVTIETKWDYRVVIACALYAVITSIFLGAQVVGFVASHVSYSEHIESVKFKVLEEEEKEWA